MKLNAVGVTTSDMRKAIAFYSLLGFDFSDINAEEDHVEPKTPPGSARLMIDAKKIVEGIIGTKPEPGNHSAFALQYDSAKQVNEVAEKVKNAGFTVVKEPWDAFWGQRYAVVEDPDGYKVDLYAN